ncbi:hypothetical protein F3X89_21950 [Rhizobium rhizogenes]|uniref:hypothetical protein n=1 Tax=Rhizobium rhizogenes TaxID=359 RepID=UPI00193E1A25|nr:hypothetical protein [Rhizobium rhizogenes]QRM40488.1 hypothetical protein F3X89_21950 [Rhizobium rhizogenes]
MVWAAKTKELQLTKITGHAPAKKSGIRGRAPEVRAITFTPAELFGAMARCSSLHLVDADAVMAETETCRHLLQRYVGEDGDAFAILKTADRLKDFSRTHFAGVVGAGIAYLQMIRDGYTWCDHFENLAFSGKAPTTRSPDFVFNRRGERSVALSESKATRGSSRGQFDGTVKRGYLEQVSPYLGMQVGCSLVTHGFSIGSWMTSPTRAEILIHHTEPTNGDTDGSDEGTDPTDVKRGNYLTVLSLLLGSDVAQAARFGTWIASGSRFVTARWLGREWLLGFAPLPERYLLGTVDSAAWIEDRLSSSFAFNGFALDLGVARRFFRSLEPGALAVNPLDNLPEIDDRLMVEARAFDSAIFPDGFAVIGRDAELEFVSVNAPLPLDAETTVVEPNEFEFNLNGETTLKLPRWDDLTDEQTQRPGQQRTWLDE